MPRPPCGRPLHLRLRLRVLPLEDDCLRRDTAGFLLKRNSHSCIFTREPLKRTPSASRRRRCSKPDSAGKAILPPAATTRCHGNPCDCRNAHTTCRAAPGKPAARATAPYVETLPRGIFRMMERIRGNIFSNITTCLDMCSRGG